MVEFSSETILAWYFHFGRLLIIDSFSLIDKRVHGIFSIPLILTYLCIYILNRFLINRSYLGIASDDVFTHIKIYFKFSGFMAFQLRINKQYTLSCNTIWLATLCYIYSLLFLVFCLLWVNWLVLLFYFISSVDLISILMFKNCLKLP